MSEQEIEKKEDFSVVIKFRTILDFLDFIHAAKKGNLSMLIDQVQDGRITNGIMKENK